MQWEVCKVEEEDDDYPQVGNVQLGDVLVGSLHCVQQDTEAFLKIKLQ